MRFFLHQQGQDARFHLGNRRAHSAFRSQVSDADRRSCERSDRIPHHRCSPLHHQRCGHAQRILGRNDTEEGQAVGEIIQTIYKGDHYQVLVRNDEDDFVVDTIYTWNESDKVSVKIPSDKISLKLKQEAKNYIYER